MTTSDDSEKAAPPVSGAPSPWPGGDLAPPPEIMSLPRELVEPDRYGLWRSQKPRIALTIAGLDPSGGAGVIADLRTFDALGIYGTAVAATLTAQSTQGMTGRLDVATDFITNQIHELFMDRRPYAIKTGALGNRDTIEEITYALKKDDYTGPLVIDPVITSSNGEPLFDDSAVDALIKRLIPRAMLITPNTREVERLVGFEVFDAKDMEAAAVRLVSMGAHAALITGGKLTDGAKVSAADVYCDAREIVVFQSPWIEGDTPHGTGCMISAAVTAGLAWGKSVRTSVEDARRFVRFAIENPVLPGSGAAVANPFAAIRLRGTGRQKGGGRASRLYKRQSR